MAIQKVSAGTLYKQGRIYWYAYRVIDESGPRRVSVSLQTTLEKEARVKVREIRLRLDLGIDPVETGRQNISINELIVQYREYSKTRKAPKTITRDEITLKRFAEVFGNKSVGRISRQEIENYFSQIQNRKSRTVNREIVTIKGLFTKAAEWNIRPESPAKGIEQRKFQQNQIKWLTDDEITKILKNTPDGFWKNTIFLLLETGIRIGEFKALEWKDINLQNKTIQITASKTYSVRTARVTERLLPILQNWKSKKGKLCPYSESHPSRKIIAICKNAGIKAGPHTFRHTFASRLVMAGVNLRTVQVLMGHRSILTTMIYSHLAPDYLNDAERTGYKF